MERFGALPDSLSELAEADLDALEQKANERLAALKQVTNASAEDRAELAAIKAARPALAAERASRAEFAADLTELTAEPEAVVEAAGAVAEPGEESEVEEEVEEPAEPILEPVLASAAQKPPAKKAQPSTAVAEATKPPFTIVAAADVPGFGVGANMPDLDTLAEALHKKARTLADSHGNQTSYPVATIEKTFGKGYDLSILNEEDSWNALAAGTKPEVLVASGGWCAPSQILYDLLDLECVRDQLFTLPTFRVTRGGIRFPTYDTFDPAFDPSFVWTEADDIAVSGTKPCITLDCPVFEECRLDAHGLCITVGNLMDRAYPENVRFQIRRAIRAYERAVALRILTAVIAGSTAVTVDASFGTGSALISSLLLQAVDYRQENGLCCGETLDVVFPCWVADTVRADVARQEGTLSIGSLPSNADVTSWFASVGLNVRYINNWQTFATHPATTWPDTVDYLLLAPGSWVRFDGGRLDLGVIRDSTLNATNDFTAVWFEEFYCIGNRGPASRIVTNTICQLGEVGGRNPSTGEATCPTG
jgi:hypothetical protein